VVRVEVDSHETRTRIGRREGRRRIAVRRPELAVVELVGRRRREAVQRRDEPEPRRAEVILEAADVGDVGDVFGAGRVVLSVPT
jgi:hypothetical protein